MCFSPDHMQAIPHWLMSSDGVEPDIALKMLFERIAMQYSVKYQVAYPVLHLSLPN